MTQRRRRLLIVLAVAVTAIVLVVLSTFALYFFYVSTTGGEGSLAEAERLRAVVESIPTPEDGQGIDRDYAAKRFANGEWVLGVGRDSHGWMSRYHGGGTVVVKDSRGQLRCFFGHVCGPAAHQDYWYNSRSLDDFYRNLTEGTSFTEYQWPRPLGQGRAVALPKASP
jgi:hypothetical protein